MSLIERNRLEGRQGEGEIAREGGMKGREGGMERGCGTISKHSNRSKNTFNDILCASLSTQNFSHFILILFFSGYIFKISEGFECRCFTYESFLCGLF